MTPRPTRCIHFAYGQVSLSGRLPARWLSRVIALEARVGQRSCPAQWQSDGTYHCHFHSRKKVLRATIWARLQDGNQVRVRTYLVINAGADKPRAMLDQALDQIERYTFTHIPDRPAERAQIDNPDALSIHWVIPDFQQGSGGHASIFRMAGELKRLGHRNHFWIIGDCQHADPGAYIDQHFGSLNCPTRLLAPHQLDQVQGDVVVATNYRSAYYVRGIRQVVRKCYLVQDYEPSFFPMGFDYHVARHTYTFGFQLIAAGYWLTSMLRRDGADEVASFGFGYAPECYFPAPTDASQNTSPARLFRIAFYGRISTERRMVVLGLLALAELARRRTDFIVHFFGQTSGDNPLPYPYVDEGVLAPAELGQLYRDCDLGLVFSATNHSIVPGEMMACGLPVVELDGENNQMTYPPGSICLAEAVPAAIADAVCRLLDSPTARDQQRRAALEYAAGLSWESATQTVVTTLKGHRP